MDAMEVLESREKEIEAATLAAQTLLQISRGSSNPILSLPPLWPVHGRRSRQITMAGILYAKREAELAASSPATPFALVSSPSDASATASTSGAAPPRQKRKSKAAVVKEERKLLSSPPAVPSPPKKKKKQTIGELNALLTSLLSENEKLQKGVEETRNRLQELRTENERVKDLLAAREKGAKEGETERKTMETALAETAKEKGVEHKTGRGCLLLPDLNLPPPESSG